jgi:hypothetical protein
MMFAAEKGREAIALHAERLIAETCGDDEDLLLDVLTHTRRVLYEGGLLPGDLPPLNDVDAFIRAAFWENGALDEIVGHYVSLRYVLEADSLVGIAHKLTPPYLGDWGNQ